MTEPAKRRLWARIYLDEVETRWFHRHVLRRRWRSRVLHTGLLDEAEVERALHRPDNATFTLHDPLEALSYVEA